MNKEYYAYDNWDDNVLQIS
uniref:Uncharacterized protein n=1 Tax=Arundo donax TaxID=35708 RepID=A0A0A9EG90_ARUDO